MFQLLNKLSWLLSYTSWFIISFLVLNSFFGFYWEWYSSVILLLIWTVLSFFIKNSFFPEEYIQERLEFFAEAIKNSETKSPISEETTKDDIYIETPEVTEKTIETNVLQPIQEEELHSEKETIQNITLSEQQEEIIEKVEKSDEIEIYTEEKPLYITTLLTKFFSENILAKIGAMLVFIGVVFLMSLIWNQIPAIWKLILGFTIGFLCFVAGWQLTQKWAQAEWHILLGTWILINFLVILSGKHILTIDGSNAELLTTGATFILLILNSALGVVTSFVYKSRQLLIFSFLFAYLNPFFVGWSSTTPYILLWYSLILSISALFIGMKKQDILMIWSAFVLGNVLTIIAPFSSEIWWATKIITSAVLSWATIYTIIKTKIISDISPVFIWIFAVIFLHLLQLNGIDSTSILIAYFSYISLIIWGLFGIVWAFHKKYISNVWRLLFLPIALLFWLLITGSLGYIVPTLGIVTISYLVAFYYLMDKMTGILQYIFFIILWAFLFITNFVLNIELNVETLSTFELMVTLWVALTFILSTFALTRSEKSNFLYSVGTIGGILILSPILIYKNDCFVQFCENNMIAIWLSVLSIWIFSISAIMLPFIKKSLIETKNISATLIPQAGISLFVGVQLYLYGEIYFPGVSLGYAFVVLSILYLMVACYFIQKTGIEKIKTNKHLQNITYIFILISISFFSFAIALIFANHPSVVAAVWLFEATILFFFSNRTNDTKIQTIWLILFAIGSLKLIWFTQQVEAKDYIQLIPLTVIFASLIANLTYFQKDDSVQKNIHDVIHVWAIAFIGLSLFEIIPSTGHGWSLLWTTAFISVLSYFYAKYNSIFIKYVFAFVFGIIALWHSIAAMTIFHAIDAAAVPHLRVLQYLTTTLFVWIFLQWKSLDNSKTIDTSLVVSLCLYILVILSMYVFDIFNTTFAITIFWAIVSGWLLLSWISKDIIKYRTIGLYLLSLILTKIFLFDIWYWLDDAATRVVALIGIGILLIVISTRYTSKYGNNLKWEFELKNITK